MSPQNASPELPQQMFAVVLHAFDQGLDGTTCEQRPVPTPGPGDVLIQIAAAPINPSDLMFVQGKYIRKRLPVIAGFEGAGTIVAIGEGVGMERIGQRVQCVAAEGDGTWAEYMLAKAVRCVPLHESVSLEQGAMLMVNPLTAWALLEGAQRQGIKAVVQTAAAGALGKMIIRLGQRLGISVINVVRRAEQIEELRAIGAEHVLSSSDPNFDQQLREVCKSSGAMLAFDAVGGEMTGRVLQALPNGGRITVYGGLAEQPCVIPVDQFIFRNKVVDGFWLSTWMPAQQPADLLSAFQRIQTLIGAEFQSEVRARFKLQDASAALKAYSAQMSGGKILFTPSPALLTASSEPTKR